MIRELSPGQARQVAVRAQLLTAHRPGSLHDVVRHLTLLQADRTSYVAPSADLVLWSRLGSSYAVEELDAALAHRALVELRGMVRPAEDIALFRAEMALWPGPEPLRPWQRDLAAWVEANDRCRRDILARLDAEGPLLPRELDDTCVVPWRSSGWSNDQNVVKMLDLLVQRGEVATAGRRGRDRLVDLAERVYPDDPVVPYDEALRQRSALWLRAMGVMKPRWTDASGHQVDVGDIGVPVRLEGTRGTWFVDASYLVRLDDSHDGSPRAALLSPLDRLVFDRQRTEALLGFDYQLEMYKPKAKRRWGYWALPVLFGDRLVGKLDAQADRARGELRVDALHEDSPWSEEVRDAVHAEVRDLARWLDLDLRMPGADD